MRRVNTCQLYILQRACAPNAHGMFYAGPAKWPGEAPSGITIQTLNGLVDRGLLKPSRNSLYEITTAGEEVAAAFVMCIACSTPIPNAETVARHKCEHGVWCEPLAVFSDTRRYKEPSRAKREDKPDRRSGSCKKCNDKTAAQHRTCLGERQRSFPVPDDGRCACGASYRGEGECANCGD